MNWKTVLHAVKVSRQDFALRLELFSSSSARTLLSTTVLLFFRFVITLIFLLAMDHIIVIGSPRSLLLFSAASGTLFGSYLAFTSVNFRQSFALCLLALLANALLSRLSLSLTSGSLDVYVFFSHFSVLLWIFLACAMFNFLFWRYRQTPGFEVLAIWYGKPGNAHHHCFSCFFVKFFLSFSGRSPQ